ncbi:hypothetical protein E3Q19_03608 [Wallemia mellicola]|uniref:Uncharacterized protein n=1 Tax=Wallemia mellicola TaxID=1708541 RepID=A0AB38MZK2_9BASI|nr:hypothetical protein E3Q19_03608 [Wallemia mellicola]TIC07797.1 hypothetical protein E3Q16_00228 [Wallemia mellicola]TIC37267.1 hypothetical protein E3Q09_00785 [Wallemia mellicola]TIC45950.1 hypothetical protein E3Q08_00869 [Wallemia mellicola]TIC57127.1 hypothetical protein E3Q04_00575 [Wallemia mellicola]
MKRQSDTYLAALRAMEQAGMREANHLHLGQPRYSSSGVKIAIINEGTCSKETLDETLIEGVTAVVDWLFESKCAKCCARLTHGGGWSATLKVLSDSKRMDPAILNCEQTTKYNCKWNEDGPQPSCGLWYNHDVL